MARLARTPGPRTLDLAAQLQTAETVNEFIRATWRILPDPPNLEYVKAPDVQVCEFICRGYLEGDCDDAATLAASLLHVLNLPCWLIAIRLGRHREFSHVFARTLTFDLTGEIDIDPIVNPEQLPLRFAESIEIAV